VADQAEIDIGAGETPLARAMDPSLAGPPAAP
jgi:hypothetical protein